MMNKLLNKWHNLSAGVRASTVFFLANVITAGIAYITTPIYTRLLTSEQYGMTALFLTWLQLIRIVATFCLSYGVFNNGMLDFKEDRDVYSNSMLALSNIITIITLAVMLLIYPFIQPYLQIDTPLLLLMFAIFLTQPAFNFWIARQRYELKYRTTAILTVVESFVSPLIAVIAIYLYQDNKLYARLFGGEIPLILLYLVIYAWIVYKAKGRIKIKYWWYALKFNIFLIPHYLSSYILGNSDKVMISYLIDNSATAFYSVAYSIASVVIIVWTAANASLVPFTYEKCEARDYKSISNVTMPILGLFGVLCVLIVLLAPEVINIMATEDYAEAMYAIPPVVGGVFFQVQYNMYANILFYKKKPVFVMIGSIIATGLNILLNYIFIPQFGYIAAGYTTLICYLIQAAIDFCAMKYVMKDSIYDIKKIIILSAVVVAILLLCTKIYQYFIIRYLVVALLLLLAIINKKN